MRGDLATTSISGALNCVFLFLGQLRRCAILSLLLRNFKVVRPAGLGIERSKALEHLSLGHIALELVAARIASPGKRWHREPPRHRATRSNTFCCHGRSTTPASLDSCRHRSENTGECPIPTVLLADYHFAAIIFPPGSLLQTRCNSASAICLQ